MSKKKETRNKSCGDYSQAVEIFMTNSVQFCVKLANFKPDFLHDTCSQKHFLMLGIGPGPRL